MALSTTECWLVIGSGGRYAYYMKTMEIGNPTGCNCGSCSCAYRKAVWGGVRNGEKIQNKLQEWGWKRDVFEKKERQGETCSVLETEPGIQWERRKKAKQRSLEEAGDEQRNLRYNEREERKRNRGCEEAGDEQREQTREFRKRIWLWAVLDQENVGLYRDLGACVSTVGDVIAEYHR